MEILNLKRVFEVMNKLSSKQSEMWEQDKYIYLMGARSEYHETSFESFLGYYSFSIGDENIAVYNISYIDENWTTEDYSYIPINLLCFSDEELDDYIKIAVKKELERIEKEKISEKEDIKRQIELLNKRLNTL
jgi:hypothetical protein